MGRNIVVGDIHGRANALQQCFDQSNFDFENDTLISLGDYADGGNQVYEVVELLLKVQNLIPILGNHDQWFIDWLDYGTHPANWLQGGIGTLTSYIRNIDPNIPILAAGQQGYKTSLNPSDVPESHRRFWKSLNVKYIDGLNRCFVHGGFNRDFPLSQQDVEIFYWNRDLWYQAMSYQFATISPQHTPEFRMAEKFSEVYIGHTTTMMWTYNKLWRQDKRTLPITDPIKAGPIWNMDTGAGNIGGKLTFMDVDTKQIWQSDIIK